MNPAVKSTFEGTGEVKTQGLPFPRPLLYSLGNSLVTSHHHDRVARKLRDKGRKPDWVCEMAIIEA